MQAASLLGICLALAGCGSSAASPVDDGLLPPAAGARSSTVSATVSSGSTSGDCAASGTSSGAAGSNGGGPGPDGGAGGSSNGAGAVGAASGSGTFGVWGRGLPQAGPAAVARLDTPPA